MLSALPIIIYIYPFIYSKQENSVIKSQNTRGKGKAHSIKLLNGNNIEVLSKTFIGIAKMSIH